MKRKATREEPQPATTPREEARGTDPKRHLVGEPMKLEKRCHAREEMSPSRRRSAVATPGEEAWRRALDRAPNFTLQQKLAIIGSKTVIVDCRTTTETFRGGHQNRDGRCHR